MSHEGIRAVVMTSRSEDHKPSRVSFPLKSETLQPVLLELDFIVQGCLDRLDSKSLTLQSFFVLTCSARIPIVTRRVGSPVILASPGGGTGAVISLCVLQHDSDGFAVMCGAACGCAGQPPRG